VALQQLAAETHQTVAMVERQARALQDRLVLLQAQVLLTAVVVAHLLALVQAMQVVQAVAAKVVALQAVQQLPVQQTVAVAAVADHPLDHRLVLRVGRALYISNMQQLTR
jgi:hypothetical protein